LDETLQALFDPTVQGIPSTLLALRRLALGKLRLAYQPSVMTKMLCID
jgi:hypothetical protein